MNLIEIFTFAILLYTRVNIYSVGTNVTSKDVKEKKYRTYFSSPEHETFVFLRQRRFLSKHSGRGVDRFYMRRIFH